jgi:hypothetical protein
VGEFALNFIVQLADVLMFNFLCCCVALWPYLYSAERKLKKIWQGINPYHSSTASNKLMFACVVVPGTVKI